MTHSIKAVVVDDELLARQLIREFLIEFPDIEVAAECSNGSEAVARLNNQLPDLLFLDIQMPGLTGFEVLEQLNQIPPYLIFSTAYDQFAIRAFEVNALDYLLKPYDLKRFSNAVHKVLERKKDQQQLASLDGLLRQLKPESPFQTRILVKKGRHIVPLELRTVSHIEAAGDYSELFFEGQTFLSNSNLSELEERLDPAVFIRIHRSILLNIQYLKYLEKDGQGGMIATLLDGTTKRVSRPHAAQLRHWIV